MTFRADDQVWPPFAQAEAATLVAFLDYQRDTLRSLGLKRIGDSVVRDDTPQNRGYVKTVAHLVKVEEID